MANAGNLLEELERRLPDFDEPIGININGCPNACARFQVADSRLGRARRQVRHQARRRRVDGEAVLVDMLAKTRGLGGSNALGATGRRVGALGR
ncbi:MULTISPECIES: hypothetical protein [Pseudofrankia]|uniref:hypothetical protein n=1 Tax=Pseudofrankia TaxID=2994363 RepID=UPI000234D1A5|nr:MULTISPECIES: hypothetical protein [Pseudofrankia]OHV41706.1 hypothetical protein BCD49_02025 [Pseudofrankia sp. EUN1h]